MKRLPSLVYEREFVGTVVGVDEAGRGPLAGPVFSAAVAVNDCVIDGINDSKRISAIKRLELYEEIISKYKYAVGRAEVAEIDRINILEATKLSMKRAIFSLQKKLKIHHVLIDGMSLPEDLGVSATCIKNGDSISVSIAAASIVAKVLRDKLMQRLHEEMPLYNWQKNKGYGTKDHIIAIKRHGASIYHRKSFSPVKDMYV